MFVPMAFAVISRGDHAVEARLGSEEGISGWSLGRGDLSSLFTICCIVL